MRLLWVAAAETVPDAERFRTSSTGFSVEIAPSGWEGIERIGLASYDAVLASFPIPDWTPEEFLEEVQRIHALTPVIIREYSGSLRSAVHMTKLGAYYYVDDKIPDRELRGVIESAVEYRRSRELALFGAAISPEPWKKLLVGDSQAMQNVGQIIRLIGSRRCTVLISGGTGTGKEMAARAIHLASGRAHLPMVPVNCTALPENLLEAELFGHVRGAFTGAINQRIGRFEQAHRSTIFLDEIADMPLDIQAKLLRVLQEREFQRIGSSETVRVDVRVIAASNADLVERIREGRFREDLYYRLNVVPITMPPLRERESDIPLLVHHFIDKICRQEEIPPKQVSADTIERLMGYPWPGNVRQLENSVEMAIALSGDRETLYAGDFRLPQSTRNHARPLPAHVSLPENGLDFEATVGKIERNILEQALLRTGGNKKQAAEMLRLKRTTLSAKLRSLDSLPALQ